MSLFLPLKILIVVSSESVPAYFGKYFEKDYIVFVFMSLVPLLYVAYIASGVLGRRLMDSSLSNSVKNILEGEVGNEKKLEMINSKVCTSLLARFYLIFC